MKKPDRSGPLPILQKKTSLVVPRFSTTSGAAVSGPLTSITAGAARLPGWRMCTETTEPISPSSTPSVASKSTLRAS